MELKAREAAISAEQAKLADREGKTGAAEDQVAQILKEKSQLENKLQDKEAEIAALHKQLEEKQPSSANPGAATSTELQAQLDDTRQQLDAAEREKSFLSEKVQAVTERSAQVEDEKKRRAVVHRKIGVQGKVLAVNQAYNFVVLNLGGRNGVEPHSEMLIVRDGTPGDGSLPLGRRNPPGLEGHQPDAPRQEAQQRRRPVVGGTFEKNELGKAVRGGQHAHFLRDPEKGRRIG